MAFITPCISSFCQSFHGTALSRTCSPKVRCYRPNPPAIPARQHISANLVDPLGPKLGPTSATSEREARIQLWREVEALKKSLSIAVNAERFSDAARIRDQIQSLSLADDYFRTETELKKAVKEQRFTEAARLRDVLKLLDPPPGLASLCVDEKVSESAIKDSGLQMAQMKPDDVNNWSTTKTNGISVHIESYYIPEQSLPEQDRYLFGYKVTITNESEETCQLVSRHWIIDSAVGPKSEVKGPGVVGRQPVLQPKESFDYTSACPITGPLQSGQSILGNMSGLYVFCKGDTGEVKFDVDIDPFYFRLPFRNYKPSAS